MATICPSLIDIDMVRLWSEKSDWKSTPSPDDTLVASLFASMTSETSIPFGMLDSGLHSSVVTTICTYSVSRREVTWRGIPLHELYER